LEDQRSPVLYLRSFEDEDRLSVEEEELAKLDEQFKTLQIRPSGLSAVPGANFQENG
jgi:hypothetical protein